MTQPPKQDESSMEAAIMNVEWSATGQSGKGLYATHEGVLNVAGFALRCYRLNDGKTVFDADDFEKFMGIESQDRMEGSG